MVVLYLFIVSDGCVHVLFVHLLYMLTNLNKAEKETESTLLPCVNDWPIEFNMQVPPSLASIVLQFLIYMYVIV